MIILTLLIFGLCLGSFVNALVWRLHTKRNWVSERSMCVYCKHELAPKDLVPVLSWIYLRGKCRYCHKKIEDTPITEAVTALLFIVSYLAWPYDLTIIGWMVFITWLLALVVLVALVLYDLRWMLLPNGLVLALTVLSGVLVGLRAVDEGTVASIVGPLLGALLIAGFFWTLFQISGGKWIGGGDVKLAVALGLLAGSPLKALLVIFMASVLGTVVAVPSLLSKKMTATSKIPFGPFLIAATILVFLWGQVAIDWYLHSILYM